MSAPGASATPNADTARLAALLDAAAAKMANILNNRSLNPVVAEARCTRVACEAIGEVRNSLVGVVGGELTSEFIARIAQLYFETHWYVSVGDINVRRAWQILCDNA